MEIKQNRLQLSNFLMATLIFRWSIFFLVLLCRVLSFSVAAIAAVSFSRVEYLPGFDGALSFELETGYVGVGEMEEVQLFYYFVKSEGNPETDPLMTWHIGGPGCSGFTGLFFDIGPLKFKIEPYNGTLPQLILNPYSWSKNTSILFIDAPVYTGFSYSRIPQGAKKGDILQVEQNHQFLRKLAAHPEFITNPFYVGGDSYGGMIVPPLTHAISEGNKHIVPVINLQGYIVGNPITIRLSNENLKIPFAHNMNLISTKLYKSLVSTCKGEYMRIDPNNVECIKHVADFKKCVSRINVWCILFRFCVPPREIIVGLRRSLFNTCEHEQLRLPLKAPPPNVSIDCQEYEDVLGYYWVNDDQVQKALHIREGTNEEWVRCNTTDDYENDIESVVPYHMKLGSKGYRSLVYSGDHDMMVPTIDTEAWITSLNYSIVDDWRPWFVLDDQILGYTTTYANNLTFVTIKGGGHTASFTPYQSYIMYNRWITREAL